MSHHNFFYPIVSFGADRQLLYGTNPVRDNRSVDGDDMRTEADSPERWESQASKQQSLVPLGLVQTQETDTTSADVEEGGLTPPVPRQTIFEPTSPTQNIHQELEKQTKEKIEQKVLGQLVMLVPKDIQVIYKTFLAVSTSAHQNMYSRLIPLRDYPSADSLKVGIMEVMFVKTEEISVTVNYSWWIDRRLEFVLGKREDFIFLLQRAKEYLDLDESHKMCVVRMEIRPEIWVGC
ncbi:MAG: hypothetical protein M1835_004624 [Candelina submexicana]|nr:MAG: hypothetical protein M1835_004624 [Candelina submexicana]